MPDASQPSVFAAPLEPGAALWLTGEYDGVYARVLEVRSAVALAVNLTGIKLVLVGRIEPHAGKGRTFAVTSSKRWVAAPKRSHKRKGATTT